jgi:hypothetical protein
MSCYYSYDCYKIMHANLCCWYPTQIEAKYSVKHTALTDQRCFSQGYINSEKHAIILQVTHMPMNLEL